MSKKLLSIVVAAVLIAAGVLLVLVFSSALKPKADTNGAILFYGDGCPHCKIVDDFIKANDIEAKVKFSRLEVFNNRGNAGILLQKAQSCGLDTNQIGVPFLWDGKKCIMGDQDVVKFFKDKSQIQ